jgi:hypothetical protein
VLFGDFGEPASVLVAKSAENLGDGAHAHTPFITELMMARASSWPLLVRCR